MGSVLGRPVLSAPRPPPNESMMLFLESPSALDWVLSAWPGRGTCISQNPFLCGVLS